MSRRKSEQDDLFERRPLPQVVAVALAKLGGRAATENLVKTVKRMMTMDEYEGWVGPAFTQAVVKSAKVRRVDATEDVYVIAGEVAALRLFTIEEFTEKARQLARQSKASRDAVYRLADACMTIHERSFDADAILAEADAA